MSVQFSGLGEMRDIRDLKQPRRRAEWTPTGNVLTKPATSAHVSDVVHMAFRP